MTAQDLERINPIVLNPNITLTPEQISVCRLPDKFVPTPRCPIDVHDMVQGTRRWAERLRWEYFWQKRKDQDQSQDEEYVPTPWYRNTKRPAPKGNPALEAFINACTDDFLDPTHRKRISDNLTRDQRIAITELSNLPMTAIAACR